MEAAGRFSGATINLKGELIISFTVEDREKILAELEAIQEKPRLKITAKVFRERRSLNANAYFWQLVDKIAKKYGSDAWTIYLLQLSKYGVFTDVDVKTEALTTLKQHFRYIEILKEGPERSEARCFFGSSGYDTKEMAELIDGTVRDAREAGIDTMTPDEIKALIAAWEGGTADGY